MPEKPTTRWKFHLIACAAYAFAFILVRFLIHGLLEADSIGIAVLGYPFFVLVRKICEYGKNWRITPPYIFFACCILVGLVRGAIRAFVLAQQYETIWPAVEHVALVIGGTGAVAFCLWLATRSKRFPWSY